MSDKYDQTETDDVDVNESVKDPINLDYEKMPSAIAWYLMNYHKLKECNLFACEWK